VSDECCEQQTESDTEKDGSAVVAPVEGLIVHGEGSWVNGVPMDL